MPKPEDIQMGVPAAEVITGEPGVDLTGAAGQTPAAEENAEVVAAFKAKAEDEVAKRQALEEELRRVNEQLLMQANPPQTPKAPPDIFEGKEDFENITVAESRQLQAEAVQRTNQLLTNIQINNFVNANPDFSEIVGTYQQGRLNSAEALNDLIKDNPSMRYLLNLPPAAAQVVYQMTKNHKELKELKAQQTANTEHQIQVNVDNKLSPLSPAAVGGGGGGPTGGEPTNEQVDVAFDRALAGEFG